MRRITESAMQYARMQQAEAAGHARDSQRTPPPAGRAPADELIHQAVHDLRGNVQSITHGGGSLGETNLADDARDRIRRADPARAWTPSPHGG